MGSLGAALKFWSYGRLWEIWWPGNASGSSRMARTLMLVALTLRGSTDGDGEADHPGDGVRQPGQILSAVSWRRQASMLSGSRHKTNSDIRRALNGSAPFSTRQAWPVISNRSDSASQ